jgi:hypothetical protein
MNEIKQIRYFTKELLDELLEKNNAILIGEYENINSKTKIKFKCLCGNEGCKSFSTMPDYSIQCRKCVNKIMLEKTKITNNKKYGCDDPNQLTSIKDKIKKIFMEKYGVASAFESEKVKNKIKKTNIKKYGCENPFQNEEVKNKIKDTLLNKYGVEHPLQNKEIYAKFKDTLNKNYNVDIPCHSNEIKEKTKETCLKKYGVEYYLQTKEKEYKSKETCLKKYGVEYAMQSNEIQEKSQCNAFKQKKYSMPSGEIRNIQGYEKYAIRDLLLIYDETQIITLRKNIPRISYVFNNTNKYYFPDIYIPHENKIIEVKSTWTYKCKNELIQLKSDATKNAGYNYEIWIYNNKGIKVN